MGGKSRVVVGLSGSTLTAVQGSAGRGGVRVKRTLDREIPPEINRMDAEDTGRWVGSALEESGLPRGRVTIAVPRSDVVLKQIEIPGMSGLSTDELFSAVGLHARRQLTLTSEDVVVDFVVPSRGSPGSLVLVAAMPTGRLEWLRRMAQSAGLTPDAVTLRPSGSAALVGGGASDDDDPTELVVWANRSTVEFVVCRAGRVLFARGVEFGESAASADRIAIEANRTVMSYRVLSDLPPVDRACVLGAAGGEVAARIEAQLGIEVRGEPGSGVIGSDSDVPSAVLPLAGLLGADRTLGFDFLSPASPPDTGARRRQLVLAAVGGVVVAGVAGALFADMALEDRRQELAAAKATQTERGAQYVAYLLDAARRNHLSVWDDQDVSLVRHAEAVVSAMPPPGEIRLNALSARFDASTAFDPGGGVDDLARWSPRRRCTLTVDASGDAAAILAFRAALLAQDEYEVSTRGADTPGEVSLTLTSTRLSPERGESVPASNPADGGEG